MSIDSVPSGDRIQFSRENLLALRESPLAQGMPEGLNIPGELRVNMFHVPEDVNGTNFLHNKYDSRAGG